MTRNKLAGEVFGFLAEPDSVPLAMVHEAIDQGVTAVYRRAKNNRWFRNAREKYLPLEGDKDEIELGPEVEEVLRLFRMDQGGARSYPLDPRSEEVAEQMFDETPAYSHTVQPDGRVRLHQVPSSSYGPLEGIRLWYRPQPVPLTNDLQSPDLPPAVHEMVVIEALIRLSNKDGLKLANERAFADFKKRVDVEFVNYLTPSFEESSPVAADFSNIYDQEGSF